jgi:hypothetical protein
MRHLHRAVSAAIAIALCTAPAVLANDAHHYHRGPTVTPSTGELMGELWSQLYSVPLPENPAFGGNGDHCLKLARRVVEAVEGGPCNVSKGTVDVIGLGTAWSSAEPPFPTTQADQQAISLAADVGFFARIRLIIDNGAPIDIRTPRFELFSQQRTVQLPEDNIAGAPAQTATFSAHGWFARIRGLRPGHHTIVQDALLVDGDHQTLAYTINVLRTDKRPNA